MEATYGDFDLKLEVISVVSLAFKYDCSLGDLVEKVEEVAGGGRVEVKGRLEAVKVEVNLGPEYELV